MKSPAGFCTGGSSPRRSRRARRAKLRLLRDLPGQPLALDGHNVLITLECAARNLPLVAADDGFIRDVGEVSRAFKVSDGHRPGPDAHGRLSGGPCHRAP